MKKFIKQMLVYLNQVEKNSIEFEQFKKDNLSLVSSFNDEIHKKDDTVQGFTFSSFSSTVKSFSKKHRSYELSCPLFKNGEELGVANIFFIMEPHIKTIEKIFENKLTIVGIYIENNEIGCIYKNKKGALDYFVEKTIIEMVTVKDVTVDISLISNLP